MQDPNLDRAVAAMNELRAAMQSGRVPPERMGEANAHLRSLIDTVKRMAAPPSTMEALSQAPRSFAGAAIQGVGTALDAPLEVGGAVMSKVAEMLLPDSVKGAATAIGQAAMRESPAAGLIQRAQAAAMPPGMGAAVQAYGGAPAIEQTGQEIQQNMDPRLYDTWLGGKIPRAVGSTLPMMPAAAVLGPAGAAASGIAQGASGGLQEARESGATPGEALAYGASQGALGATEAFGVGKVGKYLRRGAPVRNILTAGAGEAAEEGIQEGVQYGGEVLGQKLTYNPEREFKASELGERVATGAIVGGGIGGAGQAVQNRYMRGEQDPLVKQVAERVERRKAQPPPTEPDGWEDIGVTSAVARFGGTVAEPKTDDELFVDELGQVLGTKVVFVEGDTEADAAFDTDANIIVLNRNRAAESGMKSLFFHELVHKGAEGEGAKRLYESIQAADPDGLARVLEANGTDPDSLTDRDTEEAVSLYAEAVTPWVEQHLADNSFAEYAQRNPDIFDWAQGAAVKLVNKLGRMNLLTPEQRRAYEVFNQVENDVGLAKEAAQNPSQVRNLSRGAQVVTDLLKSLTNSKPYQATMMPRVDPNAPLALPAPSSVPDVVVTPEGTAFDRPAMQRMQDLGMSGLPEQYDPKGLNIREPVETLNKGLEAYGKRRQELQARGEPVSKKWFGHIKELYKDEVLLLAERAEALTQSREVMIGIEEGGVAALESIKRLHSLGLIPKPTKEGLLKGLQDYRKRRAEMQARGEAVSKSWFGHIKEQYKDELLLLAEKAEGLTGSREVMTGIEEGDVAALTSLKRLHNLGLIPSPTPAGFIKGLQDYRKRRAELQARGEPVSKELFSGGTKKAPPTPAPAQSPSVEPKVEEAVIAKAAPKATPAQKENIKAVRKKAAEKKQATAKPVVEVKPEREPSAEAKAAVGREWKSKTGSYQVVGVSIDSKGREVAVIQPKGKPKSFRFEHPIGELDSLVWVDEAGARAATPEPKQAKAKKPATYEEVLAAEKAKVDAKERAKQDALAIEKEVDQKAYIATSKPLSIKGYTTDKLFRIVKEGGRYHFLANAIKDGWFTDGRIAFKIQDDERAELTAKSTGLLSGDEQGAPISKVIDAAKPDKRLELGAVRPRPISKGKPNKNDAPIHLYYPQGSVGKDGAGIALNAEYDRTILDRYPGAEVWSSKNKNGPVLYVDNGQTIGLVMPITVDAEISFRQPDPRQKLAARNRKTGRDVLYGKAVAAARNAQETKVAKAFGLKPNFFQRVMEGPNSSRGQFAGWYIARAIFNKYARAYRVSQDADDLGISDKRNPLADVISLREPKMQVEYQWLTQKMQDAGKLLAKGGIRPDYSPAEDPSRPSLNRYLQAVGQPWRKKAQLADAAADLMAQDDTLTQEAAEAQVKDAAAAARARAVRELVEEEGLSQDQAEKAVPKDFGKAFMSDEDAKAMVDAAESGPAAEQYKAIKQLVQEVNDRTLQRLVENGLRSKEWAAKMRKRYGPYYTPFKNWPDEQFRIATGSHNIPEDLFKKAKGRTSEASAVFEQLLAQSAAVIDASLRNRNMLAYAELVKNAEAYYETDAYKALKKARESILDPGDYNAGTVEENTFKVFMPEEGKPKDWAEEQARKWIGKGISRETGRAIVPIRFYRDGVPAYFATRDPMVFTEMIGADSVRWFYLMRWLPALTGWRAKTLTKWSIDFLAANPVRDFQQARIGLTIEHGREFTKKYLTVKNWRKYRRIMAKPESEMTAEELALVKRFRESGASVQWVQRKTLDELVQELEKMTSKQAKMQQPGAVRIKAKEMMDYIGNTTESIENATRLMVFASMLEEGASETVAAAKARRVTTDFTQRGLWAPYLNALYLFAGVNLTSIGRTLRLLAQTKATSVKDGRVLSAAGHQFFSTGAGIATRLILLGAITNFMNQLLGGEEDESGIPWNAMAPSWDKTGFIRLPTGAENTWISMPAPWGFGYFHGMGVLMSDFAMGNIGFERYLSENARIFFQSFSPLSGGTLLQTLSPDFADPAVQVFENRSWSGRPLMPEDNPFQPYTPDSERHFANESAWAVALAKQMNAATGGSETESGAFDWHPTSYRLALEYFTGAAGKSIERVYEATTSAMSESKKFGEDFFMSDIPIIRNFVKQAQVGPFASETYERRRREVGQAAVNLKDAADKMKRATSQADYDAAAAKLRGVAQEERSFLEPTVKVSDTERVSLLDLQKVVDARLSELYKQRKAASTDEDRKRYNQQITRLKLWYATKTQQLD